MKNLLFFFLLFLFQFFLTDVSQCCKLHLSNRIYHYSDKHGYHFIGKCGCDFGYAFFSKIEGFNGQMKIFSNENKPCVNLSERENGSDIFLLTFDELKMAKIFFAFAKDDASRFASISELFVDDALLETVVTGDKKYLLFAEKSGEDYYCINLIPTDSGRSRATIKKELGVSTFYQLFELRKTLKNYEKRKTCIINLHSDLTDASEIWNFSRGEVEFSSYSKPQYYEAARLSNGKIVSNKNSFLTDFFYYDNLKIKMEESTFEIVINPKRILENRKLTINKHNLTLQKKALNRGKNVYLITGFDEKEYDIDIKMRLEINGITREIIRYSEQNPESNIRARILGYADTKKYQHNQWLSSKRAQAVHQAMSEYMDKIYELPEKERREYNFKHFNPVGKGTEKDIRAVEIVVEIDRY